MCDWSEITRLVGLRWRYDVIVADRVNFAGLRQTFTQGLVRRKVDPMLSASAVMFVNP